MILKKKFKKNFKLIKVWINNLVIIKAKAQWVIFLQTKNHHWAKLKHKIQKKTQNHHWTKVSNLKQQKEHQAKQVHKLIKTKDNLNHKIKKI